MNRQNAEKIIIEYSRPVFGFALKRCKNIHDAEDLSQEIVIKAFRALLGKNDIADTSKFIWTVAHNALSNYYRDTAKSIVAVPIDELEESILDPHCEIPTDDKDELFKRLRSEIAYLSKLQREIITAYYFENHKQVDIARKMDIPLGTVKWHLFEAKKELKRGMDTMRNSSDLKFNPIKFHSYNFKGSTGTVSQDEFFRSSLSQNICYSVRNTAKTINHIADDLGVSPVYVETEIEFLEKYGFLLKIKEKFIANFLISEPSTELLTMQNKMYKYAAKLFANDLYDELISSDILDDPDIICYQTKKPISLASSPKADRNFVLWSLIPYIASCSSDHLMDSHISFDEVATIRPDGAYNIFHAYVVSDNMILPDEYIHMNNWEEPMWNKIDDTMIWQMDSIWADRLPAKERNIFEEQEKIVTLYNLEKDQMLSKEDYAWLSEREYIKTNGDYDGYFKSSWQFVQLLSNTINHKLLSIGECIKEKHKSEFEALKAAYVKEISKSVPVHLKKVQEYEMQFIFSSDKWFIIHCIMELLKNGKLKEPTKEQKKSLSTLLINYKI